MLLLKKEICLKYQKLFNNEYLFFGKNNKERRQEKMADQREEFVERLKVPQGENKRAQQLMNDNPKLSVDDAMEQAFMDMLQESFGKKSSGDIEGVDR